MMWDIIESIGILRVVGIGLTILLWGSNIAHHFLNASSVGAAVLVTVVYLLGEWIAYCLRKRRRRKTSEVRSSLVCVPHYSEQQIKDNQVKICRDSYDAAAKKVSECRQKLENLEQQKGNLSLEEYEQQRKRIQGDLDIAQDLSRSNLIAYRNALKDAQ